MLYSLTSKLQCSGLNVPKLSRIGLLVETPQREFHNKAIFPYPQAMLLSDSGIRFKHHYFMRKECGISSGA